MRVLLRNLHTGQYFQASEQWTENRKDAFAFASSAEAIQSALEIPHSDLELLLTFDDPLHDVRLPLNALLRKSKSPPPTAPGS